MTKRKMRRVLVGLFTMALVLCMGFVPMTVKASELVYKYVFDQAGFFNNSFYEELVEVNESVYNDTGIGVLIDVLPMDTFDEKAVSNLLANTTGSWSEDQIVVLYFQYSDKSIGVSDAGGKLDESVKSEIAQKYASIEGDEPEYQAAIKEANEMIANALTGGGDQAEETTETEEVVPEESEPEESLEAEEPVTEEVAEVEEPTETTTTQAEETIEEESSGVPNALIIVGIVIVAAAVGGGIFLATKKK